jgi:phosphopentomutase
MSRAIVIIIDGIGVGELPDAERYGDQGSDTLGNLSRCVGGLTLPHMEALGLGYIHEIEGVGRPPYPQASFGKMKEQSPGKDSTTGHWELAGLILDKPFPLYPHGFPEEVISEFVKRSGCEVIGNYPASGTEIIKELGEEHLQTGKLIVYTSADSVFQIAAHEEIIPLERLYQMCRIARSVLAGDHAVARIIARPFIGTDRKNFSRTENRKDFSLKPFHPTLLDILQVKAIPTIAIGKINDLYAHQGISVALETKNNMQGMESLVQTLEQFPAGLIMANLVDFDMLWGHRNDVKGFKTGLENFDRWLGKFLTRLDPDDLLVLTSDHGNDPTTPGTDHSREYIPVLVHGQRLKSGINLGIRKTFADLQASLAEFFNVPGTPNGESFLRMVR